MLFVLLYVLPTAQYDGLVPNLVEFEARIDTVGSVQKADLLHFLTIIVDVSERGHEGKIDNTSVDASNTVDILAK